MNEAIGFIGLAALFVMIAVRVPIGIALITASFGGIWALIGLPAATSTLKIAPYGFAANWQLSSVPMFLFMGFLCYHAGITHGLFNAARVWLVRLPGGLAIASVFGSAGFAAITGSSVACAAAMGRIAVPEMLRSNYSPSLATGTVAAAGTVGALIPPSIIFIIFGILAEQPIGKLFLGGAMAGLLTVLSYMLVIVIWVLLKPSAAPRLTEQYTIRDRVRTLPSILPAIVLAGAVFGGLFTGLFTPTEAGAVGSGISILVALFMRTLTWVNFRKSLVESFTTSATLFIIAIGANMLTRFVSLSGADEGIAAFVIQISGDPMLLLAFIALIYLVLGMFLDPTGAMLLTLPILIPVAANAGFDMIWFGVIIVKLLEIGMITPPVGLNVFVIKSVLGEGVTLGTIFKGVVYFLIADAIVLLLLIAFPDIVLLLPEMFG
ncbi:TRAP transporter large permease [Oceanicola sp. 502str15]|uniref:TRAP transporter large permease n=1 Tax=Oceanicola sp. 502str15 TaxID=2696061 RepID=UPI00209524E7|nr:TRAP transporter large permease [Oceanicola sp. 502str15]MCO6381765.1 TRAP transporter large permease subunit [Oceanicola sp. 502str15]